MGILNKLAALILLISICPSAWGQVFDPRTDGWYFTNWGEQGTNCIGSCDLSWYLFRETYLGINPTQDCIEAPLDCAFYEIFKNCGANGNCGGMSLLALALFKYGGYLGFCSPAAFYTGTVSPDREDLHRAINMLQARQFSASGIENFIDVVDAGHLNNAEAAFFTIRDSLARGDYPVLSIANSVFGEAAHTVIPYRVLDGPSGGYPKRIFIWDPNLPYDDNPSHYDTGANFMTVNGPQDWVYVQSPTRTYSSSPGGGAWCFAIPMSVILPKSRHPLALDMVFDALQTAFVTGPGAAVVQISDDQGKRLYKSGGPSLGLETDPAKRLKGAVKWLWPSSDFITGGAPGELYFLKRTVGKVDGLTFEITGNSYRATIGAAGNLIRLEARSNEYVKDSIRVGDLGTSSQSVQIETLAGARNFSIRQIRSDLKTNDWRAIEINDISVKSGSPVSFETVGNMEAVVVRSREQSVGFNIEMQQRVRGKFLSRRSEGLATSAGRPLRLAPENWRELDKTPIEKRLLDLP
ncbi:hypothetical protein GW871_11780 [bacterium]|nr:hypothetical protein [bacterium]